MPLYFADIWLKHVQHKKSKNIYQVNQMNRENNIRFPIESAIEALHQQLIHNNNLNNADNKAF